MEIEVLIGLVGVAVLAALFYVYSKKSEKVDTVADVEIVPKPAPAPKPVAKTPAKKTPVKKAAPAKAPAKTAKKPAPKKAPAKPRKTKLTVAK